MQFVLDLEYTGPPKQCAVYEIAVVRLHDNAAFHRFVRYDTTAFVACPGAPVISESFLDAHDARVAKDVIHDLIEWMPKHALIYAHDCFRCDQPILEQFLNQHIPNPPTTWMFSDTLLHARANIRMRSYRLEDLVRVLSRGASPFQHEFCALQDANALVSILHNLNVFTNPGTFPVPWGYRSVRVIPGIGYRKELDLRFLHGITTESEVFALQPHVRNTILSPDVCLLLESITKTRDNNGHNNETSCENENGSH